MGRALLPCETGTTGGSSPEIQSKRFKLGLSICSAFPGYARCALQGGKLFRLAAISIALGALQGAPRGRHDTGNNRGIILDNLSHLFERLYNVQRKLCFADMSCNIYYCMTSITVEQQKSVMNY